MLYVAQSGVSSASTSKSAKPILYQAAQSNYTLQNGEQRLLVTLTGKTTDGITVVKNFSFYRGDYAIATSVQLTNATKRAWQGNIYNQITRRDITNDGFSSRSYHGASISTSNTPYKKLTYENMSEGDLSRDLKDSWIAMQQHYFLSAWIAPKNQTLHYYSRSFGSGNDGEGNIFVLGFMSPMIQLAPNASNTFQSTLYVGPEIAKNLESLGKGLELTVDYGWLSPISKLLFWLLSEIDHFVGNWGWSIVFVTVVIKIAFYWFSNKSYASMAKTRDLQPKIKALRDRFGDDKQAMSKAMMELYRKEKVNPIGGCLPMLIQIPVFIALYYVLIESVELRQASWIFWIHDLSMKDPYFVLPVLMGLSMLLQQKLSPPPPDPAQAKMMMFLPIIFTVFFATFPAGLVLYWFTNNCVSVLHQWYAMKAHEKRKITRAANR
ncbi:MAG: membrane protein insertase YidC [Candidatus Spechtbacteria bacterium RIFCSPLOWO2_02_FULL_38_8]|uniref:Membrane protein insertase YidC n=1 Tax=Candidatus Spechtbacteria bacterium RIFCSPLOWO2_02_FULL_38_8 TaxID=1802164 RepID=A0A1G2HHG7_9BACT|nr:MAG: membrane protein insertase YidC [Candidatus Spechtbacteria bacterium RIFCSPLOWO2_02_FULL_38_8]